VDGAGIAGRKFLILALDDIKLGITFESAVPDRLKLSASLSD
jgi:hypothetical protein